MLQSVMRSKKLIFLLSASILIVAIVLGCKSVQSNAASTAPLPTTLQPGPNDAKIAYVTAGLLEAYHYLQRPLDKELSEKFFYEYVGGMEGLDPRHENFLQSDIDEFGIYRTNLDHLTTGGHTADLTPAFVIWQRYNERFQQHVAYVDELLKQDKFKFTGDDTFAFDRRHAPFPKNLDEAKALWRERARYEYLQEKLAREIFETNNAFVVKLPAGANTNIITTLENRYRWLLHVTTNGGSDYVLQTYLNALAHAYDPHSDYLSAPHAQDFSIIMSLGLVGIGAQLSEDDGYCTIQSLIPGGPASKSKMLKEGDRIIAVAQTNKPPVDTVDMDLEKVVQMIRGLKNTEVRLTISPAEDRAARHVVTLVRDQIKLEDSEAKAKLIEQPDGKRIGIIDLPSFYATIPLPGNETVAPKFVSTDVTKLIQKLKQEKISGLVLDLRSNPGGSLEEAIRFVGLFIKNGPVVLARDPDGKVFVRSDDDPSVLYDGPLVVMINRFSASASEIVAAALQDYGRALIVGDTSTHGKGTVQNLNELKSYVFSTNDPGTVKITISKFYRINGASTQLKGVVPDIILPDIWNYSTQVGESSLDNPLPWDTISAVNYNKLNLVQPSLMRLRADSNARLTTNQDFSYIREDIAQFKKLQLNETSPLNEREALKEREQIEKQNEARDKERASRLESKEKVFEITVENSGDLNLPAPIPYYTYTTNGVANATSANLPLQLLNHNGEFDNETHSELHAQQTNAIGLAASATPSGSNSSTNQISKTVSADYQPDPMLDETERILDDYISLLANKSNTLIANH
jgi:carboxyl-terminal processing protease